MRLLDNTDESWERLARLDAYHAVLTADEYRKDRINPESFFRSGDEHIARVSKTVHDLGFAFAPELAVDFGCGVGRLLIPLSRLSARVAGVDVSKTMLAEASNNLAARSVTNAVLCESLSAVPDGVDFIHSCLVFQHIPVKRGYALFGSLLTKIQPGGLGAVHFTLWRDAPVWRTWASKLTNISAVNALVNLARGKPASHPKMQINHYSIRRLLGMLKDHGCELAKLEAVFDPPETMGATLYFKKITAPQV